MFSTQHQPKFTFKYQFLGIYSPKESLNHNSFHFYTEPQPGFSKVSLYRKSAKKPITMYYENMPIDQYVQKKQHIPDTSTIIDFQYFTTRKKNQQGVKNVIDRSKMVKDSEWVKKYEPTKFIQLLTDDMINRNLLTWVKAWDPIVFNKSTKKKIVMPMMFNRTAPNSKFQKPGENNYLQAIFNNPKKLILLAGPPGCGKTTLVRVLANHCKYEVVEINASEDRSANNLIRKLEDIAGNNTIRGNKKPALICLDQIDGIAEGQASGITKVIQYIQTGKKPKKQQNTNKQQQTKEKGKSQINFTVNKTKDTKGKKDPYQQNKFTKKESNGTNLNRPVIFICNDPFAKSLKQLRTKAHVIYFTQLCEDRVVKRMRQILEKEKVVIELQVLHKICEICRNDIRSCIGILELVVRQKRLSNKNPKDIINKMKLSFAKDNQSSINQFLQGLFTKKTEANFQKEHLNSQGFMNISRYLQTQVFQIYNPSLLMQTFLQNFLHVQGVARKGKSFLRIYEDLINSDRLMKNGFKFNNELERYHVLPYLGFSCCFDGQDYRKIQFPNNFFEKLRKLKTNKQLLKKIFDNIPIQLRIFLNRQSFVGCYLLAIFMAMQTSSTKQSQIIKCVSVMLTYGFTLRKQKQVYIKNSIFSPEIDTLVTFGQRKPEILISNVIRTMMQQNYEFFKQRKQMLVDHELKDNTTAMINQMNLQSRKKKNQNKEQGLKYKFIEGTGTKISYSITMSYFF